MGNGSLNAARKAKNDEFYTQLEDIERELYHYRDKFEGKRVYLSCDDPERSNFWRYFRLKFDELGLDRLTSTHYVSPERWERGERSYRLEMRAGDERDDEGLVRAVRTPLEGCGDFRDGECVAILDESDIVVTNPPFSLFREFIALLVGHGKQFIVIGSQNAITYREVFPLLKDDEMWLGVNSGGMRFEVPDGYELSGATTAGDGRRYAKLGNICWFTNVDNRRRHTRLDLWDEYSPERYPKYDGFDAIEVSKVSDIPCDYDGLMGVPITFLDKHDPDQFEIVGLDGPDPDRWYGRSPSVNGKKRYRRIIIRRKQS